MLDPKAVIDEFLASHDLDYEQKDESTYLITLPGVNAFVIRKPDENKAGVYEYLLKKNAGMYSVAFAVNELGDIYLVGRLPLKAVNEQEIDRILGAVLQYADSSFNPLLELGFSSAIRREWAWRVSRGESLSNLKAFEHLI
jgi:hypothetical protein